MIIFIVLALLFIPSLALADTHVAASCSQANVQTAINASTAGDTVTVPAGTCTWGASNTSVGITKAITLQGNGIDSTIINMSTGSPTYGSGVVAISAAATVKGFTFNVPTGTTYATLFTADTDNFRITGNKYVGTTGSCTGYFAYISNAYGVIDSNTIIGSASDQELIFSRGPTNSWQTASSLGTANAIYVEDNTFSNTGYISDFNANSRAVVRYNTISSESKIDAHGKCTNTPARGARHVEIYGNSWTATGGYSMAIEIRSGTGMIYYNKSANTGGAAWYALQDYATFQTNCGGYSSTCCCPGNYPCDDQIGVGIDPKSAASEPMYTWTNYVGTTNWDSQIGHGDSQIDGGGCNVAGICGTSYTAITQVAANRDHYSYNASFNGTTGTGCGTLGSRPATCTAGVGYWATTQSCASGLTGMIGASPSTPISGTLYKCTSTNTWTSYYTPYTYPHPLRSGEIPPAVIPTSAQGLTCSGCSIR